MIDTLKLTAKDPEKDIEDIKTAAGIILNGGVVAIPTETVYGLAADAFNEEAVKKIFDAKDRPADNPLIVHISDFNEIYSVASVVPESAKKLAEKFWPGPLTMVLPKSENIPYVTSGGLDTVAVRTPSNKAALKIIELSRPLAAPSANISGFPSPTTFGAVLDDMFGRVDAVCDGGDCLVGVESTVISLAGETPTLLRPGKITVSDLESVLGKIDVSSAVLNPLKVGEKASSPGMKYKHYSPKADITVFKGGFPGYLRYLKTEEGKRFDGCLCFTGEEKYLSRKKTAVMGLENDPMSQANRLFSSLRELDETGALNVLARNPSKDGVGLAVCNRLYRAAGFKFIDRENRVVIGLTGPTGAGKTFAAEYLKSKGFYISDTDKISRDIIKKDGSVLSRLKENFGNDIVDSQGNLKRGVLAKKAFKTRESTELLNSITHPEIVKISLNMCEKALDSGFRGAVIDAPLLFESGADRFCDAVIAVTAPFEVRLKRIMERDDIAKEKALLRMSAQQNDDFYTEKSDFNIKSYGDFDVPKQIDEAIDGIFF